MSCLRCVTSCYKTTLDNRAKRLSFNSQLNKLNLNISQFYSLKKILNEYEQEEDAEEKTFDKLEYAAKLGLTFFLLI